RGIEHEGHEVRKIAPERGGAPLPIARIRGRRALRPPLLLPLREPPARRAAEIEDHALADPHVLEQLPGVVRHPGRPDGAKLLGHPRERRLERDMGERAAEKLGETEAEVGFHDFFFWY